MVARPPLKVHEKKTMKLRTYFPLLACFSLIIFINKHTQAHVVLVGTHLDDKYLDPQTLKKQLMEVRALYHPQVAPGASPPGMCILCVVYAWTFKHSCVCLCVNARIFACIICMPF